MSFGRKSTAPASPDFGAAQSVDPSQSNAQTDTWDELLAKHGNSATTAHHSTRHSKLSDVADLTTSVVDIYIIGTIAGDILGASDVMLGGGFDLAGAGLGGSDAAAGGADMGESTLAAASDLLGSVFRG
ncbi:MAG: hypothetical protein AAF687_06800 [Pseudomonadota bacterium]